MLYIYGMNANSKTAIEKVAVQLAWLAAEPLANLLSQEIEKTLKEHPDLGMRKATALAKKHLKASLPGLKDAVHNTVSVEGSTLSISVKPIIEAVKSMPHSKSKSPKK
jgi:hypothetical protein